MALPDPRRPRRRATPARTRPAALWAVVSPRDDGDGVDAEVVDERGRVRVRLEGYRTIELPGGVDADALAPIRAAMGGELSGDAAPVHAPGDRQPRRAGDAAHPRRARAQRAARGADPPDRALHRGRARRDVRPPRRRGVLPRVRAVDRADGDRSALPRPRRARAGAGRDAGRRRLGRLGLRRRAPRVRRAVRAARHRLRRPRRRRSCACVGDKIAAKRLAEEAGVPGRALERRPRRRPSTRRCAHADARSASR